VRDDHGGRSGSDRALNKVDRRISAEGPDRLWVADITYVPAWSGIVRASESLPSNSQRSGTSIPKAMAMGD
jgi:transposase InsO family protein